MNRDPNPKALTRRGCINHGSTFSSTVSFKAWHLGAPGFSAQKQASSRLHCCGASPTPLTLGFRAWGLGLRV